MDWIPTIVALLVVVLVEWLVRSRDGAATRPDATVPPHVVLASPPPPLTPLEAALLLPRGRRGVVGEVVDLSRRGVVDVRRGTSGQHEVVARDLIRPVPATTGAVVRALFGDPPEAVVTPGTDRSAQRRLRRVTRQVRRDLRRRGLLRRTWWPLATPLTVLGTAVVVSLAPEPFSVALFGLLVLLAGILLISRLGGAPRLTPAGREQVRHLRALDEALSHPGAGGGRSLGWSASAPAAAALVPLAVVLGHHARAADELEAQLGLARQAVGDGGVVSGGSTDGSDHDDPAWMGDTSWLHDGGFGEADSVWGGLDAFVESGTADGGWGDAGGSSDGGGGDGGGGDGGGGGD